MPRTVRERINLEARMLGHALERHDVAGILDCCYQLRKIVNEAEVIAKMTEQEFWYVVNQLTIEA